MCDAYAWLLFIRNFAGRRIHVANVFINNLGHVARLIECA